MLQDFWDSIPLWVVIVAAVVILAALYVVLIPVLGLPVWMFWLVFGGIAVGGVVSLVSALFGGGL